MLSFIQSVVILLSFFTIQSFQAEESVPRAHARALDKAASTKTSTSHSVVPTSDVAHPVPKQYETFYDRSKKGPEHLLQAHVVELCQKPSSTSSHKSSTTSGKHTTSSTSTHKSSSSTKSGKSSTSTAKKPSSTSTSHHSSSPSTSKHSSTSATKHSTTTTSKQPSSSSTNHSSTTTSKKSTASSHTSKSSSSSSHSSAKSSSHSSTSKKSTSTKPCSTHKSTSTTHSSSKPSSTSHTSNTSTKISTSISSSVSSSPSSSSASSSTISTSTLASTTSTAATTSFTSSTLTTVSALESTTTSLPSNSTSPGNSTQSSCFPTFALVGVAEETFNPVSVPFQVTVTGCSLDVDNTFALFNFQTNNAAVLSHEITFTGLYNAYTLLSIYGFTTAGNPIFVTYELHAGSQTMPVRVLDPSGNPVPNVVVTGEATAYPGVTETCTTDALGLCSLTDVPPVTIALLAVSGDNSVAVDGLAASNALVTLTLIPLHTPAGNASFAVKNGLSGWQINGGAGYPSQNVKRDQPTFVLSTHGQPNLQTASNAFTVHSFTKSVYITYQFQTNEFPGGYFGSQYNDYYSVIIRSNKGGFITDTNSMNALGKGAFDSSGATELITVALPLTAGTTAVSFDLGVSNVADAYYDSQVIVTKAGETDCDHCGDCTSCPINPMCQPSCSAPAPQTCSFYRNCAEKTLTCGPTGYALNYGERTCLRFSNNINYFSSAGQAWIWGTMSCLQTALVPVLEPCTASCTSLQTSAFNSFPSCYVLNGFCALTCPDILEVMLTANTDLFTTASLKQVFQANGQCLSQVVSTLQGCTAQMLSNSPFYYENSVGSQKAANALIASGLDFFKNLGQ